MPNPTRPSQAYGVVAGGLFGLLLCLPPQLPDSPRQAEAVSSSAGPRPALDELEQPMLSATSAIRGRSARMGNSYSLVRVAGDRVGASSAEPRRLGGVQEQQAEFPSAARRSWGPSWRQAGVPFGVAEESEDPWLCGPGFGRVCPCQGMVWLCD
jgi:hypothetical protein